MKIQPEVYKCEKGYCIVGDDTTKEPNAISNPNIEGKLIIPKKHESLPITAIGQYAFKNCGKITEIEIRADITVIKVRAFSDMYSLKTVKFPSSLKRIEDYGIHFYNKSRPNGISTGFVQIYFGDNSQLEYLGIEAFGFKPNVFIYYTSNKSPTCSNNAFTYTTTKHIFAPTEFSFCNIITVKASDFQLFNKESKKVFSNIIISQTFPLCCIFLLQG